MAIQSNGSGIHHAAVTANGSRSRQPRVLLYSHDTYGLGHLRRCLKIAWALKTAYPEICILLITGSPHASRYKFPDGMDFVKLPAVVKDGRDSYRPRSLGCTFEQVLELRKSIIFEATRAFDPHLMIVDHSPIGMKGELLEALFWLKDQDSPCHLVLGMRDVIDGPEEVIPSWEAEGVYEILDVIYDQILVYGAPEIFDPTRAYHFDEPACQKTSFTGFITGYNDPPNDSASESDRRYDDDKEVFLTVGGGEDGAHIVETYMEMLSRYQKDLNAHTTIVTGPFFPESVKSALLVAARVLGVDFLDFIPDLSEHLQRADLVVSMGGYNTVTEILSNAGKALIIPRAYPRREQLIRAQRLSEMGLLSYMAPDHLSADSLYEAVSSLLSEERRPLVEARNEGSLPLQGSTRVAALCRSYLETRVEVTA